MMRRKDYVIKLLIKIVFVALLAAVAVTMYQYYNDTNTVETDPLDAALPEVVASGQKQVLIPGALPDQELLSALNLHYASLPEADVSSYSMSGRYITNDAEYAFENYAKQNKRYRQSIRINTTEYSASFNGLHYTESRDNQLVDKKAEGIERLNPYILKMESSFYALPWAFLRTGELKLRVLKSESSGGVKTLVIENKDFLEVPVLHHLDPKTGREISREATVVLDEQAHLITIEYTYAKLGDPEGSLTVEPAQVQLAGYSVKVDGTVYTTAKVDAYRCNLGMPDWFFDQ